MLKTNCHFYLGKKTDYHKQLVPHFFCLFEFYKETQKGMADPKIVATPTRFKNRAVD